MVVSDAYYSLDSTIAILSIFSSSSIDLAGLAIERCVIATPNQGKEHSVSLVEVHSIE